MKPYYGSNTIIEQIDLSRCKPYKDFRQGPHQSWWSCISSKPILCLSTISLFRSILPKVNIVSPFCAIDAIWCMILCYAKWCDDVMLCKMIFVPKTHIPIVEYTISLPFIFRLHRLFFGVSALTFRSKFCISLGTSFELLRLLFRRYSCWLFVLRLIFRRYLALHSLWNDFWAENLHCAPLGTIFWSFGKLTLRSLGTTFCSFSKFTLCSLGTTFVASVKLAM